MAIPGHNSVYVLFGCLLAWLGWIGLDSAGAILYTGAEVGRVVLIAINASLGAASSALAVAGLTRMRFGKPDASLCANGWIGGLVATSAGCASIPPAAAIIIGLIAGVLVTYSIEWLELHLSIDDPGGSISVHALGGLWGLLATGWFARLGDANAEGSQWMAQLAGIATLVGFVLPLTYGFNWLLNRFRPMRVPPEGERLGLDLYELGAGAYPDFLTHNDDLQR
jgi:Amt family ammonium transporter